MHSNAHLSIGSGVAADSTGILFSVMQTITLNGTYDPGFASGNLAGFVTSLEMQLTVKSSLTGQIQQVPGLLLWKSPKRSPPVLMFKVVAVLHRVIISQAWV
jgi:hypothetical protein